MNIEVYLKHCSDVELCELKDKVDKHFFIRRINSQKKLADTDLSAKVINALRYNNIQTINQVSYLTQLELSRLTGIGRKAMIDIVKMLEEHGLKLKRG